MESVNEEVIKAAIRGLFDTDGSFYAAKQHYVSGIAYSGRLSIGMASKTLYEQVLQLFSKIGFSCRVSYSPPNKCNNRNNNESNISSFYMNS